MEIMNNEIETSLSLIIKSEIDVQVSTAKAYPRSISDFLKKAESMAITNEDVASSCTYSVPRGGKDLDGPSVRLAEICCTCYGNIRSGARVISNDGKTITAQGICHDLENNNVVTIEVTKSILDKNGKSYSKDMQVVTGNAACAVAYRNAVFKVIPGALISEIYAKVKTVARGTAQTLAKRREKTVSYLNEIGVTNDEICAVLEIKKIEDMDLDKLDTLRGMCTLIKNGESTSKELFASNKQTISHEDLSELYDLKKDSLSKSDNAFAKRVLENNEKASFIKLNNILKSI